VKLVRDREEKNSEIISRFIFYSEEDEDEEIDETDDDDEEEVTPSPVIKHLKTRMVTRQMSLIINHQSKPKPIVKIQPFVDHSEETMSEHGDNPPSSRLRPRRAHANGQSANNGAEFFIRITPIDDDDTSQPAAFSSVKKESLFYYTTPERPDDADIDYEQLVNRTRIKPASLDQCNQGQLLPEESFDTGNDTRPTELIPYLLELEQSLMPVLPIVKQKKSK